MRTRFSLATAGLVGLAAAAGLVLVGGAAAGAATPVYEPDPQAVGTLALYDASGNQVTSGNINNPLAVYAVGSATVRSGDVKAVIFGASPNPDATSTHSRDWSVEQFTSFTGYPLSSGPANIQTLSQTQPVATIASGDETLATFIGDFPNTTAADSQTAYQNLYQIRLETANGSGQFQTGVYDEMDVLVSGTTWTQVYPAVATSTSTVLTSSANPTTTGTSITLTATETAADTTHPAGSVQFVDGTTNIGSPVAVNASGVATLNTAFSTTGAHALHAVFTPTDTSSFGASTGDLSETVNPPATPTTTALAVTQDGTAGHDVTLTATVSPAAAPGTVAFYDNGSTTAIAGTVTQNPAGTYTLDLPSGLAAGGHSIVAKFSPTDVTQFEASQSAPQSFVLQPPAVGACAQTGAQCTDTQNIQVTVPVGTLVISTPYTAASPLDLGTMNLVNNASLLTANAPFQNIVVTDTRSGDLPYTVSALASPLTTTNPTQGAGSVNVINAENVGLTGLTAAGDASYTGSLTGTHDNAAAAGVQPADTGALGLGGTTAHDVFDSDHGLGTVTMNGTLTINAPVNTVAGLYTGTITFTVG